MTILKKKYALLILLTLFVCVIPKISHSQISLTTENMALGGGGTAYLTGFESLFVNPANLYIQEKNYRFQISLLQGGLYHDTILPVPNYTDRWNHFQDHTGFFDQQTPLPDLSPNDYDTLLDRNYPRNNTTREFLSETDFYWFGLKWVRPERSYALSFRTRYATRYELGRGFFSMSPVDRNDNMILDRSFSQKSQVLHELSFGYAESFTFLNGLMPQLSEFIIGIAPKVVLSGASLDANFTNSYVMDAGSSNWIHHAEYSQQTSGVLSTYGQSFFNSGSLPSQSDHTFRDLLQPAGIGFGLDIGVTYLITFGDDLSILRQQNEPTEKSLRIGLSITDLGAVYQYKSPFQYSSQSVNRTTSEIGSISDTGFTGAPNEHYFFLSQVSEFRNLSEASQNNGSYEMLLPTSIQAGALFQYQQIKLMGDLSYSLSQTPFSHSGLASYIGIELRPLPFLPIRGGTRFARKMSGYYSFGTGLETKYFDLNLSVLLKSLNAAPTTEILGMSFLGLKFYLQ
ncbi:MAG: DUF5723 family protein [Balneolaceae bacterium]|nr:DUF5723 family protein [Balneolaceae bacterium]